MDPTLTQTIPAAVPRRLDIMAFVRFMGSVRLGVMLLVLVVILCAAGMLVMQQNVDGFAAYYAALPAWQRSLLGGLGLFDVYRSWYFLAALCLLAMNIILASVERFPSAWAYVSRPAVVMPGRWLEDRPVRFETSTTLCPTEAVDAAASILRSSGWRNVTVTQRDSNLYVFAETGAWNRLGAYAVHAALMVIFAGAYLTAQFSSSGSLTLSPGQSAAMMSRSMVHLDKVATVHDRLPFALTVTDNEQKLINLTGALTAENTLDTRTRFTLTTGAGTVEGEVGTNRPFDFEGYRLFQSATSRVGRARSATLVVIRESDDTAERITIPRGSTATLRDGTRVTLASFRANFRPGPEDPSEDTTAYLNPVAVLTVTAPEGTSATAYAGPAGAINFPQVGQPAGGYRFTLETFEKAAEQHTIGIRRDPGAGLIYIGFAALTASLFATMFFSHRRVWLRAAPGETSTQILAAAESNRDPQRLRTEFHRFTTQLAPLLDRRGGGRRGCRGD
jgi:cytochrome c biogenesis protein